MIQLVPTQTRRARLPVCARKPLGGQVLFTARTLSRPIVVVVVDAVLFTDAALHIHQRLRRRVSRAVVARLVDRARDSFRGRVTRPLASWHLDERVDSGARDSSRRAAKTNRHEK